MNSGAATAPARQRHAVAFVFVTVLIDAMGIGIILPVMPDLLQDLSGLALADAALWGGYLSFVYALMQFVCGPTIGNLSDRFGRRPVLLGSLAALTVDYLVMAAAPVLWVLFLGRAIAGVAGATYSTANAVIADVIAPADRAKTFGLIGAAFGLGFVVGPLLGGLMGELGTRMPFLAAAGLAFANLVYGAFAFVETHGPANRRAFSWRRANPLGAARQIVRMPMVAWLLVSFFLFELAHWVYPAIWAFYTREAFAWTSGQVGLSLAIVGLGIAVVQGGLIRVFLARLGEARTAIVGFLVNIAAFIGISLAREGWIVLALTPVSALGMIVTPAMTGLMSNAVPDDAQGELQGALASVMAVAVIASPLIMTQAFGHFTAAHAPVYLPAAPFLLAAVLTALAMLPMWAGLRRIGAAAEA